MFQQPFGNITKPPVPLRSSDRKKMRQLLVDRYCPDAPEDGDLLVPEGLLSMKISASNGTHGVVYLSSSGDPLWFTIGKEPDILYPAVYTLWKRPRLLPFISIPSSSINGIINGKDLTAEKVIDISSAQKSGAMVCITIDTPRTCGPALGIGHMLVNSGDIISEKVPKRKAVTMIHMYKDYLWLMGSKSDPPATACMPQSTHGEKALKDEPKECARGPELTQRPGAQSVQSRILDESATARDGNLLAAEEVSDLLRDALFLSIKNTLAHLPPSSYPVLASTLYSTYIQPARPYSITETLTSVDIKHSTHKSLTAFLKHFEKQGVLKLKNLRGDLYVFSVNSDHDGVRALESYRTVGEVEDERQRMALRGREDSSLSVSVTMTVTELWKPHDSTIKLFEEAGLSTSSLYTLSKLEAALRNYVAAHGLLDATDGHVNNLASNPVLRDALWPQQGKKPPTPPNRPSFDRLSDALRQRMEAWYRVDPGNGGDIVLRKGNLKKIEIKMERRPKGTPAKGKSTKGELTTIIGHEQFLLSSSVMAETLRVRCASSATVISNPAIGSAVIVQGEQSKRILGYLLELGIPKSWIAHADEIESKKSKK